MPTSRAYEEKQVRVDTILPSFLIGSSMDAPVGTSWTNLADLVLARWHDWDSLEDRSQIRGIVDLGRSDAAETLPRGSSLRMLQPFWEMWGYGYVAGVFFDFAVEDGPLAGRIVTVYDGIRLSWHGSLDRRPLAVAMIVPTDCPDIGDAVATWRRYDAAIEALESDPPPRIPILLPRKPLALPSDPIALGEPS